MATTVPSASVSSEASDIRLIPCGYARSTPAGPQATARTSPRCWDLCRRDWAVLTAHIAGLGPWGYGRRRARHRGAGWVIGGCSDRTNPVEFKEVLTMSAPRLTPRSLRLHRRCSTRPNWLQPDSWPFRGHTRIDYHTELRCWFACCQQHDLAVFDARRAHLELGARTMEEHQHLAPTTVVPRLSTSQASTASS